MIISLGITQKLPKMADLFRTKAKSLQTSCISWWYGTTFTSIVPGFSDETTAWNYVPRTVLKWIAEDGTEIHATYIEAQTFCLAKTVHKLGNTYVLEITASL